MEKNNKFKKKVFINEHKFIILNIIIVYCKQCRKMLLNKQENSYVEIKCKRCGTINENLE